MNGVGGQSDASHGVPPGEILPPDLGLTLTLTSDFQDVLWSLGGPW